jgi:hypothetical protein
VDIVTACVIAEYAIAAGIAHTWRLAGLMRRTSRNMANSIATWLGSAR